MAEEFDRDEFLEEITDGLSERLMEEMEAIVADTLSSNLPELLRESLQDSLSEFSFQLPDGTRVTPRDKLKVLSPDKTKQLVCFGGLRVSDTSRWNQLPEGWALEIQTRFSSWEVIFIYSSKEEAVAALEKVSAAMEQGKTFLSLE